MGDEVSDDDNPVVPAPTWTCCFVADVRWRFNCYYGCLHWIAGCLPRYRRGASWKRHRYGKHSLETYFLIQPATPVHSLEQGLAPRLPIFQIHCGGWVSGSKEVEVIPLAYHAEAGHMIMAINYPLAPEAKWPRPMTSVLRAFAQFRAKHGVQRCIVMGDSAGGSLAVMLAILMTHPEIMERIYPSMPAVEYPSIAQLVAICPVLDRVSYVNAGAQVMPKYLKALTGTDKVWCRDVPDALRVTPGDWVAEMRHALPPMFVVNGEYDWGITADNTAFLEPLQRLPGDQRVQRKQYPGVGHNFHHYFTDPVSLEMFRDINEFMAQAE